MRLFLLFILLSASLYPLELKAAEAIMPISVRIISKADWDKMQQEKLQAASAESESIYTEEYTVPITEDVVYDTDGEELTMVRPSGYQRTVSMNDLFFNRLDDDRSGFVSHNEFIENGGRRATDDLFNTLDKNLSGTLDITELSGFSYGSQVSMNIE